MALGPLIALVASGCAAHGARIPGPLGAVGKDPPPVAVLRPYVPPPTELSPSEPEPARTSELGERIADAARHWVEHRPKGFRDDCSGFVMASLDRAGVPMSGSTRSFWEDADAQGLTHTRKRPHAGDLVFFDNTYDRNRNGRWDDDLTHVGIVIDVDRDGTITVAHGGTSKGRTTMLMNLGTPDQRTSADGRELNDWLRAQKSGDPKKATYLSGELWRGFATLRDERIVAAH